MPRLLIVVAVLVAAAGPAGAQTLAEARRMCLTRPEYSEQLAKACTLVIDAPETSALQRAIALNNRSCTESGDDAKRDLDEAIRLAPTIPKLYNNRGLHLMYPEPHLSIPDFDTAIRLDPHYAVAWNNRGESYARMQNYTQAIADLTQAIRLAPAYMHPMYNPYEQRAQVLEAKGDAKAAERERTLYMPLWNRASSGREVRNANVLGIRTWEPFISEADVKAWARR